MQPAHNRKEAQGESDDDKTPTAATFPPNPLPSPQVANPSPRAIRRHVLSGDAPTESRTLLGASPTASGRSPTPRGHLLSRGLVHDHQLSYLEARNPFQPSPPLARPPPTYRQSSITSRVELPAAPLTPEAVREQRRQEALLERHQTVFRTPKVKGGRTGLGLSPSPPPTFSREQFAVLPASERQGNVFEDDVPSSQPAFPHLRSPLPNQPTAPQRGASPPHSLCPTPFRDSDLHPTTFSEYFHAQVAAAETDVASGDPPIEWPPHRSTERLQYQGSARRARETSRAEVGGTEAGIVRDSGPSSTYIEYPASLDTAFPPPHYSGKRTTSTPEIRTATYPPTSQSVSPVHQGYFLPNSERPETLYFTIATPDRKGLANNPVAPVDFRVSRQPPPLPARPTPTISTSSRGRVGVSIMASTSSSSQPQAPPMSPSSSPRLPSPPPFTEVQIGPKSPTIGEGPGDKDKMFGSVNRPDDGASRRIRPGTKAADMASGPPLVPLNELDSPFQLQEHLKALYHHHTAQKSSMSLTPVTRDVAQQLAEPPEGVERSLWLYELCRFLVQKCNDIITAFFRENPPCSALTCPEMRASEWQYLCAVHDPPKSCCAIDYCCHTLDWAGNTLTSPKLFPSRLTLGSEAAGGAQASTRHLTNVFRRVYRIFAHAWFQHRGVFWQVEGREGLYIFFKTVCDTYQLIPEDNYTIPAEAEGDNNYVDTPIEPRGTDQGRMSILKTQNGSGESSEETSSNVPIHLNTLAIEEGDATMTVSTGATTRRHKQTPSTGSFVTTIAESEEEEGAGVAKEGEKEENTPVEGKPKFDEKAKDVKNEGKVEEEIAKGVSLLDVGEEKEKEAEAEVTESNAGKAVEETTEVQAVEAAFPFAAPDEPVAEEKAVEEAGAEKVEVGGSGEV